MSFAKFKNGHKYDAKKSERAGYSFSSKLEAAVFDFLQIEKIAGEIKEIQVQAQVHLTKAKILYKPDFKCTREDNSYFYVEAKGFETPEWRIKRRLWEYYGDGELRIYMGNHSRPFLKEIIIAKI